METDTLDEECACAAESGGSSEVETQTQKKEALVPLQNRSVV